MFGDPSVVVAGGFFNFVLIQMNDVGDLEVSRNLPSLPEGLEQADELLSKCLTTHFEDFGWYSIWARGLASLQLLSSLDGLCFCWQAVVGVDQGTLRHVLNCPVFNAGGLVQQLAEVCCPTLQDVGFLLQKCAI